MPYISDRWWGIILIVLVFILILILMLIYYARNMVIPFYAGSQDSGIVATKTLKHQGPVENEYKLVAAIVEPREENLVETINHYIRVLPDYTHIQVYHGTKNKKCLESLNSYIKSGKVELFDMGVDNLTIMGYCKLLCSLEFWNTIRSEKVLIFQTDSITCGQSPYNIEEFLEYDYVGAPLPAHVNGGMRILFAIRGWSISTDFYNGGLSVRTKSLSMRVIEEYPWDGKTPEDIWFCAFMYKLGGNIASHEAAQKFGYEAISNFDEIPWGLHKPRKNKKLLEKYCPEHRSIPFIPAYTDCKTLYMV